MWRAFRRAKIVAALVASCALGCASDTAATHATRRSHRSTPATPGSRGDAALAVDAAAPSDSREDQASAVTRENERAGTTDSELQHAADAHQVEGYASAVSAAPGETIELFINVDHEQGVRWELYRMGYYRGLGARLIAAEGPARVEPQQSCAFSKSTGLIECAWSSAFSVTIQPEWATGYYTFKLINDDGFEAEVPLVVREGTRRAPILVQASVTTWQAYNTWGGTSLYKNLLPKSSGYTPAHAHRVSFDRPYAAQNELAPWTFMVRWLERKGYDVAYVTNVDVDADASILDGRKLFMTVAHDEYWSVAERDAVQNARDQGLSLAFFSANTAYWRIRLEPSSAGVDRRIVTCYKGSSQDPHKSAVDTTNLFRSDPLPRPENELIGVMLADWSNFPGFPFVVTNAQHWIYEGTGVRDNDTLSNVVGPEWDTVIDNGLSPAGLEVVADSPTIGETGFLSGHSKASVYYPTPDSVVFATGTIDWDFGLSEDPGYADRRIERMTENVLKRAGIDPPFLTKVGEFSPETSVTAPHAKVIAGSGTSGYRDGPVSSAMFDGPSSVAAGLHGELYVLDMGNQVVRKVTPDGMVSTFAGCPPGQAQSGVCFARPSAIVAGPDGTIYLTDTNHNCIRVISADGVTVTTLAGSGSAARVDATDPQQAAFSGPRGIAIGPHGELYVADTQNNAIRRIDGSGVTTLATGLGEVAGVAVGADGSVYFSTIVGAHVGVIENGQPRMLANVDGIAGDQDGRAAAAQLRPMEGLLVEPNGLVIADTGNYALRWLSLSGSGQVSTLLGTRRAGGGPDDAPNLVLPRGLTPFAGGYAVADFGNNRVVFVGRNDAIQR